MATNKGASVSIIEIKGEMIEVVTASGAAYLLTERRRKEAREKAITQGLSEAEVEEAAKNVGTVTRATIHHKANSGQLKPVLQTEVASYYAVEDVKKVPLYETGNRKRGKRSREETEKKRTLALELKRQGLSTAEISQRLGGIGLLTIRGWLKPPPASYPPGEKERVIARYKEGGRTKRDISEITGIPYTTVVRWLRDAGVEAQN